MTAYTFRKEEKLCSQKMIGEIFLSGTSFLCYPLKVVWKDVTPAVPDKAENDENNKGVREDQKTKIVADDLIVTPYRAQVVFSVPKRLFKRAHDRNLLKRRMREVYRYKKHDLYHLLEDADRKIALMIVYIAKEELEFVQIEGAMTKIITKFKKILTSQL